MEGRGVPPLLPSLLYDRPFFPDDLITLSLKIHTRYGSFIKIHSVPNEKAVLNHGRDR